MSYGLLSPRVDFVFKKIFGNEQHPNILISFLNAVLNQKDVITSVKILNTDIDKEHIDDKYSRLDIKATTNNKEHINIEIQVKNDRFHNFYRLKEVETNEELTDIQELHFIELPKYELLRISASSKERELYERRKESLLNKVSALKNAEEKGERNKTVEIGKKAILKNMDNDMIQDLTDLSIEEIEEIRKEIQ
ncbi:MAG: Rpn family recombination-promoting nuclease/putative transposase [Peptostreptococcaceae bacterium]